MNPEFPERPDITGLHIRRAARAILLTPDHDVLLVRFEFPTATVWALPGGGLDPGENHEVALSRELVEEVGLHDAEIGPYVWDRLHIVPVDGGRWDGQTDRYHLVSVPARFEPAPRLSWDELRAESLHEIRWWHLDEIDSATEVLFAPRSLAALLRSLVTDGPPSRPIDAGV